MIFGVAPFGDSWDLAYIWTSLFDLLRDNTYCYTEHRCLCISESAICIDVAFALVINPTKPTVSQRML
uniref:Uncharacterized protein n=1 Tax=Physcomitrium patens TaxID=3218 RepID=A0A2K1KMX3_PHYPA|nr:hypothetical protein PHYPA_006023 [Physcomitrium patens]